MENIDFAKWDYHLFLNPNNGIGIKLELPSIHYPIHLPMIKEYCEKRCLKYELITEPSNFGREIYIQYDLKKIFERLKEQEILLEINDIVKIMLGRLQDNDVDSVYENLKSLSYYVGIALHKENERGIDSGE